MFNNIDFYLKTRCTQGVRVFFYMRVFEIVAYRNVDVTGQNN